MATAGIPNFTIIDIFNRINETGGIKSFFKAILSCQRTSQIRHIRDELAVILPEVLDTLKYEPLMVNWIYKSAINGSDDDQVQDIIKYHGHSALGQAQ
jgi:hypothetical protein